MFPLVHKVPLREMKVAKFIQGFNVEYTKFTFLILRRTDAIRHGFSSFQLTFDWLVSSYQIPKLKKTAR